MKDVEFNLMMRGFNGFVVATFIVALTYNLGLGYAVISSQFSRFDAGDLGVVLMLPAYLLVTWLFIAVATMVPAFLMVRLVRTARLPRPISDVVGGAVIPYLYGSLLNQSVLRPYGFGEFELVLIATGGLGGLVYWFASGRPRPPYREYEATSTDQVIDRA